MSSRVIPSYVRPLTRRVPFRSCLSCRPFSSVPASDLRFGQPLHETHPHILEPGELTRGIQALEYAQRRANLAAKLPPNSVAIVAANDVKYRTGPVFYDFHQNTDFSYLTGFLEPESVAIIEKKGQGAEHTFHLYVRPKDAKQELWEGSRSGVEAAEDVFNADEAAGIEELVPRLQQLLNRGQMVYTDLPASMEPRSSITKFFIGHEPRSSFSKLLEKAGVSVKPLRPLMNSLRVVKSDAEIVNMRTAGQISGRVITEAMRSSHDREADLATFLDTGFKVGGCETSAYVPVVAGGQNALCIHYVRNDMTIAEEDLICIDAGGQYGGYIADITRTWPNKGRFTDAQRALYKVVLDVQRSCVSLCRADAKMTLDKIHKIAEKGLQDGLKSLGFDLGWNGLRELFPHHVGHYIGLDVHEAPGYSRSERLIPGHCITVEPGVYVPNSERYPEAFRGLGIRIEDSICVQEESPLNLTTEAVKEIDDIEALRN